MVHYFIFNYFSFYRGNSIGKKKWLNSFDEIDRIFQITSYLNFNNTWLYSREVYLRLQTLQAIMGKATYRISSECTKYFLSECFPEQKEPILFLALAVV